MVPLELSHTTSIHLARLRGRGGYSRLMKRSFTVVIERDPDGYLVASVPELPGCHTQAKSLDKLEERIREAIELCLEQYGETPQPTEFVGIQRVAV
jgi:predicted RNase H-like HicB family nuclease